MAANIIGKLLISLGLNSASYEQGMSKAAKTAKAGSKDIKGAFGEIGEGAEKLLSPLGEVGEEMGKAVSGIASSASSVLSSLGPIAGAFGPVGIAIGAVVAAAAALAVGWMALAVAGAEIVQNLSETSEKTGIAVRDLQTLQAAGRASGVTLGTLTTALKKLEQGLAEVGKGAGTTATVLHALGVTSKDPMQAMEQIGEALSKVEDPTKKAAYAVALFGRAGLDMIPMLNEGKEGLEEYKKMVEEFGPAISGSAIEGQKEWEKSTTRLSLAWDNLKVSAVGALGVISALTNEAAKDTKFWTDVAIDRFHDMADAWALVTTGKLSLSVTAATTDTSSADAAAKTVRDKRLADARTLHAQEQATFDLLKEGGEAQLALARARKTIADDLAAGLVKEATAIQRQLPLLEANAAAEKLRLDNIKNFPAILASVQTSISSTFDSLAPAILDPIDQIQKKTVDAVSKMQDLDRTVGDGVFGKAMQGGLQAVINKIDALGERLKAAEFQKQIEAIMASINKEASKDPIPLLFTVDEASVQASVEKANSLYAGYQAGVSEHLAKFSVDLRQQAQLAKQVYENSATGAQLYAVKLGELDILLNKNKISLEQYNQEALQLKVNLGQGGALDGAKLFFQTIQKEGSTVAKDTFQILDTAVTGFEDNLASALATGKANWADYFQSLEKMILKSSINTLFKAALGALNDSEWAGGLGGGMLFGSGSLFGGKAEGGPVMPGHSYLVGERGREIFRPSVPGNIIPNHMLTGGGGSTVHINQYISTPDANSFGRSQSQLVAAAYTDAATHSARNRGRL